MRRRLTSPVVKSHAGSDVFKATPPIRLGPERLGASISCRRCIGSRLDTCVWKAWRSSRRAPSAASNGCRTKTVTGRHITPTMSRRTSHSSARTAPHGSSEIRRCLGAECPAPSAYESRLRRLQVIPHPPNPTVAGALAADEKHVAAANKQ